QVVIELICRTELGSLDGPEALKRLLVILLSAGDGFERQIRAPIVVAGIPEVGRKKRMLLETPLPIRIEQLVEPLTFRCFVGRPGLERRKEDKQREKKSDPNTTHETLL